MKGEKMNKRMVVICSLTVLLFMAFVPQADAGLFQGLWVGDAVLYQVTELGLPAGSDPTGTPSELTTHIILHVDSGGNVRLLKDLILMRDKDNNMVLLTNDALVSNYSGVVAKDGQSVGRRISAVGIDFDAQTEADNPVKGTFKCSGDMPYSVICNITLGRTNPTNPFLHRFNPDHDEMDSFYQPIPQNSPGHEVPLIGRKISFQFGSRYPSDTRLAQGAEPPGWGDKILGGTYTEEITGLHKNTLKVIGSFTLQRISDRGELNQ